MSWEATTMRSKTSCFNKTLFCKHVTRFWPVWAAYLGVWLLVMPLGLLGERAHLTREPIYAQVTVLNQTGSTGTILAFIFACFMAMAVWSFLYSARSASGAACLPVTRTAQFTSAALGGFLPLAAVHVLIFALTALAELSLGALHLPSLLTWLGATVLELLFFFGFATLCAMLTGNIIVLPAVYAVLNFTVAGFVLLLSGVANWFVYGMNGNAGFDALQYLSPAIPLATTLQARLVYEPDAVTGAQRLVSVGFDGWLLAIIYGVVGALLLIAAWALLRRRKMETAGDVVAVQPLKPVFRWCMGIGVGLCFACMMLYVFSLHGFTQRMVFVQTAVYLVIGGVLGWLIAEMLIRRSFRVFRGGRIWGGCALCCAVLLIALTATELDVPGFERRQPKAEDVESVMVIADGQGAYLESPEGVADALALHRSIIDGKPEHDQCGQYAFFLTDDGEYRETVSVSIDYILKNGKHLFRSYQLPHTPGAQDDAAAAQTLLNCPEAVQRRKETPFPFTADNVRFGTVSAVMSARECAAAAGYDDPADYVLQELGGYTPAECAALQGEARTAAAREALAYQLAYPANYGFTDGAYRYEYEYYDKYAPAGDRLMPEDLPETPEGGLDWDRIWLDYTLELSGDEAWELYSSCLRPDTESGALGRVWIILNEDYGGAVCAGQISVAAEWPEEPAAPDGIPSTRGEYTSFVTTPTVDAQRTTAWLEARGVHFHTPAEIWGWITY